MSIFLCPKTGAYERSDRLKFSELLSWGLSQDRIDQYREFLNEETLLGRVIEVQKGRERVVTEEGMFWCTLSGRFRYTHEDAVEMPAVGDWVVLVKPMSRESTTTIVELMPRRTKFSRKVAGTSYQEQIVAANVDYIFICMALNADFNMRRLERYISLAWQSGGTPVVILTKSDLCEDRSGYQAMVEKAFIGVDTHITCGFNEDDLEKIRQLVPKNKTVVFTGSSGVGKSTLINGLIGQVKQKTQSLRNDDQGRHTTTYRELLQLEGGGLLVDTPGMREFGLLGDEEEGLGKSFKDIEDLMVRCYFNNCSHTTEKGCKVLEALEDGSLDQERYHSFIKLQKESEYMARKSSKQGQKSYMRAVSKQNRSQKKLKY
jgi:ribosome biogenesis GTPase